MPEKFNLFDNIPETSASELFDTLMQKNGVTIERIVSYGHPSPEQGWYQQIQDEWVLVVQGSAVLGFENKPDVEINAGEHIFIPAKLKHKVLSTSVNPPTIWLAVHINTQSEYFFDSGVDTPSAKS